MKIIADAVSLLFFISGIVLAVAALWHRTSHHPAPATWDPRAWKPIWRMKSWFTPKGFRLHLIGWALVLLALIIRWLCPLLYQ